MNLKTIHSIYFIGIGGVGMSAIAHYFVANGKKVAGYDKTSSNITVKLKKLGVNIHFEDAVENIPTLFLDKEKTLVIYTPAIPKDHLEFNYFLHHNFMVLKRSEILGEITKNAFCLAVAGTHGKTTVSAILGHIMKSSKATCFLGGISENYNSNVILGEDEVFVVEADEFDRSFLKLSPNIACVTSMDIDHLDIYKEPSILKRSFVEFSKKVSQTLIVAKGLPIKGLTYAVNQTADYRAFNIRIEKGNYIFDVKTPSKTIRNIEFYLLGKHNVMNALAAISMANVYGVSSKIIKKSLKSFKGIQRRFSYKIKTDDLILIDDYAHHPTEINTVEHSIRELHPNKKILAVFQPHLFSRTSDFGSDFAKALSKFDELLLLDIYPARETPIKGISSCWLLEKVTLEKKELTSKKELIEKVKKSSAKIILMLGAGDIGMMVDKVKEALENKQKIFK